MIALAQARLDQKRGDQDIANSTRPTSKPQRQAPQNRSETTISDKSWDEIDSFLEDAEKAERELPPSYRDTLLPDGALVVVNLLDVEVGNIGGAEKWFALFRILECPDLDDDGVVQMRGRTLLRSYNPPRHPWLSRNHALFQDWKAVTGRPLKTVPKRSPRAILGAYLKDVQVLAKTRIVKRQMNQETRKWDLTPKEEWYSVIDHLVKLVAGCPRVLQERRKKKW